MTDTLSYLNAPPHLTEAGEKIAYKMSPGKGPAIIWCGGLKSDMDGSKATYLHDWAKAQGRAFVRFDYYGHGQSSGKFRDGTISRWGQDVVTVIDALTDGDIILIGSSMGGWSSLLATRTRLEKIKALLLIAPAPDFTEKLMWANWPEDVKDKIIKDGIYYEASDYGEPYEYTRELIEDGRAHQLLDAPYEFAGPVRIFQGGQDDVVPWQYAQNVGDVISSENVTFNLVKSGDHSMSRPQDLHLITQALSDLCQIVQA